MRGAWLTLPLPFKLLKQYVMAAFLGLAVPSGGCGYEQAGQSSLPGPSHTHDLPSSAFLAGWVVACLCTRWLLPVLMRPHGDVVGFVYECMSVTGEALVVIMIRPSLSYFNAARIPGSAMLSCMALSYLGISVPRSESAG